MQLYSTFIYGSSKVIANIKNGLCKNTGILYPKHNRYKITITFKLL